MSQGFLKYVQFLFVVAVWSFSIPLTYAAPAPVVVTPENADQFIAISDLNRFDLAGVCYLKPKKQGVLGTITDDKFSVYVYRVPKVVRTPKGSPTPIPTPTPNYTQKELRRAVSTAQRTCRDLSKKGAGKNITVTIEGPKQSVEGSTVLLTAKITGSKAPFSFEWDFNNDGVTDSTGDVVSWQSSDNGSFDLPVYASEQSAAAKVSALSVPISAKARKRGSTRIAVTNIAPTVTLQGASTGAVNAQLAFSATATDPSAIDTSSGFIFTWNFGDGSPLVSGLNLSSVSHAFAAAGSFQVTVAAADKDQAMSQPKSMAVTIGQGGGGALDPTPIPELARWESQMLSFGLKHCQYFDSSASFDEKLAATYYDAEWVYFQLADYTKSTSWNTCAQKSEHIYRDLYANAGTGGIPGYWSFTHGLAQDYLRTGDLVSRSTLVKIAQNGAYHADYTPVSATADDLLSRENAYAMMAYLNAEDVGEPRRARLAGLVNNALGHIDQWFITKNADYIKPFMVGLTAHALIMYHEKTGDSRVIPALTIAADQLWSLWVPASEAFLYINKNAAGEDPSIPAPDLNMLIAPLYAWLYHQTGQVRFRDRGDQIFAGGVRNAYLNGPKQFNQNYRRSFDYVALRKAAPLH